MKTHTWLAVTPAAFGAAAATDANAVAVPHRRMSWHRANRASGRGASPLRHREHNRRRASNGSRRSSIADLLSIDPE